MGIQGDQPSLTISTFGLPEYRVSRLIIERVGNEVRLLCGSERFGHEQWHYIAVIHPEDLIIMASQCRAAALSAYNNDVPLLAAH